jgi:RNA polymerase sigma factor (sigma-70 family)
MADTEQRAPLGAYGEPRPVDMSTWPDAWLIEAVRGDAVDERALDALARRHWRPLFGRCRLLALNDDDASDLAQSAWVRVLRARRSLDPHGNFPAYLSAIATNLWRDGHRSARRAGAMADRAMRSLDAPPATADGTGAAPISDLLPDPHALPAEEQSLLAMDVDDALARLTPRSREMLVSRYLNGESAATIARRHGRTEQSITSWIRQALDEARLHLGASRRIGARETGS